MKNLVKISWLLAALSMLALTACGARGAATQVDAVPILTQLASTALALQTQTALAAPTATSTPQANSVPEATNTLLPTNTPLITNTPQPGAPSATPLTLKTPKPPTQASCDNMVGIDDVTYPDGTVVIPGEIMEKTWRIKNLGPCTWNQDYALTFGYGGEGTDWKNAKPAHIPNLIQPGQTVEITVTLRAPTESGSYGAYFRMKNDKGFFFGNFIWIAIRVE
jgi:hypothetical protein